MLTCRSMGVEREPRMMLIALLICALTATSVANNMTTSGLPPSSSNSSEQRNRMREQGEERATSGKEQQSQQQQQQLVVGQVQSGAIPKLPRQQQSRSNKEKQQQQIQNVDVFGPNNTDESATHQLSIDDFEDVETDVVELFRKLHLAVNFFAKLDVAINRTCFLGKYRTVWSALSSDLGRTYMTYYCVIHGISALIDILKYEKIESDNKKTNRFLIRERQRILNALITSFKHLFPKMISLFGATGETLYYENLIKNELGKKARHDFTERFQMKLNPRTNTSEIYLIIADKDFMERVDNKKTC